MASRRVQRHYAFVLSVLGHAALVAMLTLSIPLSGRNRPAVGPNVVPIDTVLIDEAAIDAEMERIAAAEEAKRVQQQQEAEERRQQQEQEQRELERIQRERQEAEQAAEQERLRLQNQAEAEKQRLAEVERQRAEAEQAAEQERLEREKQEEIARQEEAERQRQEELERQRQEEERQRQEELARQREEEERRRAAEEAARRAAVEEEIQRSIAAEQAAREARDSGLREQWAIAIGRKIEQYWNRPPNVDPNLRCVLVVTQLPDGSVTDVDVDQCTTNDQNIIRSVENAVLNASPLPQRPRGVEFERQVRITFVPAD
jgi:colicin import membrane protein